MQHYRNLESVVLCREEATAQLTPVEPLHVEIGPAEVLLPAGTISNMLEGTIVVQVSLCTLTTKLLGAYWASYAHVWSGFAHAVLRSPEHMLLNQRVCFLAYVMCVITAQSRCYLMALEDLIVFQISFQRPCT